MQPSVYLILVFQGHIMITSMTMNLQSQLVNYHTRINSLILWDLCAPKHLVQMLNTLGFSASSTYQARAVSALSKDMLCLAQTMAQDPKLVKQVAYNNFNWTSGVWETLVLHHAKQHNQVSAVLMSLYIPPGLQPAEELMSVERFLASNSARHSLPPSQLLSEILPLLHDMLVF